MNILVLVYSKNNFGAKYLHFGFIIADACWCWLLPPKLSSTDTQVSAADMVDMYGGYYIRLRSFAGVHASYMMPLYLLMPPLSTSPSLL
jgi:hypothetical protein